MQMYQTVHWICNSPTPYNDALFTEVAKRISGRFIVHFIDPTEASGETIHSKSKLYDWKRISCRLFDRDLVRAALLRDSFFVCGGWQYPLNWLLFLLAPGRFATWTDVPNEFAYRSWIKRGVRRAVLAFAFRRAKVILGTGRPGLEALVRLGAPTAKLVNFPCWVAVEDAPEPMPSLSEAIVFVAVGRLVWLKGFDVLITAAARLMHSGANDFRIVLVGAGPEQPALERAVRESGLSSHVEFRGWQSNTEVRRIICDGHVLVHPARFEPYGVVVLEAMAAGRPVLASDRTMAAVDRVQDRVNGFIVPADDADGLVEAMLSIVRNREELPRMGIAAHATASKWPLQRGVEAVLAMADATRDT